MRPAALLLLAAALTAPAQQPFTLEQILSAPYSTNLTAAPAGSLFAWVEHTEGRNNLFIGGPHQPARQLTHNTEDDAQDITNLAWSPDATAIAYTYGAQTGADGKPANPAHLQADIPLHIWLQPLALNTPAQDLGEGHAPTFLRGGCGILYLRSGKVWVRGFKDEPHPASVAIKDAPGFGSTNGVLDLPECDKTTGTHQLIFDRGSAHDLTLSPDGNTLAYISRRTEAGQPSHTYLALYDLRTLVLTFPAPSTGNDSAPTFSPDGTHLAWLRTPFTQPAEYANPRTSPNPWSIQLLDLTTSRFEGAGLQPRHHATSEEAGALAPEGNPRTIFSPTPNQPGSVLPHLSTGEPRLFFSDRNRITYFSEADGWLHLYSLDALHPDRKPILLTRGNFEVEDATLATESSRLLFSVNFDGYDSHDQDRRHIMTYLLPDPSTEELGMERVTTGVGIESHPVSSSGQIAALVSDASIPMHPALIGQDGSITPLHSTNSPTPALMTPQQILIPSPEHSKSPREAEGAGGSSPLNSASPRNRASAPAELPLTLHAQLFLPAHLNPATKHPAILFLHGGPNRQMLLGYPAMDYYSNAYAFNQYLASRGFIVLSVNYRCGIGYGLDFRQCQNAGPNGAAEYNDVLAAAAYLKTRADVDPTRIGLWGGSYGGYLTALALARNSNLFAAGVDFHGVHDWNLEDNAADWRIGTPAEKAVLSARALASSPLADITHWTSPILLIHGDNDPDVAYAQTPVLADALRARNARLPPSAQVDVEELIFPDELHTLQLHRDWLTAYTAAASFFERTLKPIPTAPQTVHSKRPSPLP